MGGDTAGPPRDGADRRTGAAPAFGDLRGGPMNHWQVQERSR